MIGGPELSVGKAISWRLVGVLLVVIGKQSCKRHFAANPELPINRRQMGSNGGRRYEQRLPDFAVGHPLGELCRDHPLPVRQAGQRIADGAKHRPKSPIRRELWSKCRHLAARRKYYSCGWKTLHLHDAIRAPALLASWQVASLGGPGPFRTGGIHGKVLHFGTTMLALLLSAGPCRSEGTQRDGKLISEDDVRTSSAELYSDILVRACRNGWRYRRSQIENGFKRHFEELKLQLVAQGHTIEPDMTATTRTGVSSRRHLTTSANLAPRASSAVPANTGSTSDLSSGPLQIPLDRQAPHQRLELHGPRLAAIEDSFNEIRRKER